MSKQYDLNTKLVHGHTGYDRTTGAVSIPIYQSATFRHGALYETTGYDYSRLQNPTREELEKTAALLDGAARGFAFSSGMAAVTSVAKLFRPGDHILLGDDLYGGVYRLFEEIYAPFGIEVSYGDISDPAAFEAAFRPNTKAVLWETPTNPMMKTADIGEISAIAKRHGALSIVDNTLLTPYLQRPLEAGADIALYSATKFLAGHNDTLAGLLTTSDLEIAERLALIQKSEGAVLSPFDSWLVLRGMKTLSVRMDRQQDNANRLAAFLAGHPLVEKVYCCGAGAVFSFSVKSHEIVKRVLSGVKLIYFAESLGGCETLITFPAVQTHSAIPEGVRERLGVTDRLLRLSVGIEDIGDLISDLRGALGE